MWRAVAFSVVSLSIVGCGDVGVKADSSPSAKQGPVVGVVFDSGGRGDKSFNDSAYAGIVRAQKEFGITDKTVDSKSEKDYEANLTAIADQGPDLIFAVGLAQMNALQAVAPKYPKIKFAIVDSVVEGPNVRSLIFAEEQGSFLAGYLAAMCSKTGQLGFVGGKEIPLIKKFEVGYEAGAKTARPDIVILPAKYTESWDDVSLGKTAANVLFGQGADIVYHAAGRSGLGVIDAARERKLLAIGVDSDQDGVAPGFVLTSMLKRVDEAVYRTIKDVVEGKFTSGAVVYDLASDGVGLADTPTMRSHVSEGINAKLPFIRDQIVGGKIRVPRTEEELTAYLQALPKR